MSYRLIDANAIADSYPEVNDMPCIYADLPRGLDGGHYDMRGTSTLQAENAKLRELAAQMVKNVECFTFATGRECDRYKECREDFKGCLYENELRELGVPDA